MSIKRGEIYYADLGKGVGSEQEGLRPVVIIQNDIGNKYSPTTVIASMTTKETKKPMPTHVRGMRENTQEHIPNFKGGIILCEQLRTIDKKRLKERIAVLNEQTLKALDKALNISIYN